MSVQISVSVSLVVPKLLCGGPAHFCSHCRQVWLHVLDWFCVRSFAMMRVSVATADKYVFIFLIVSLCWVLCHVACFCSHCQQVWLYVLNCDFVSGPLP